MLRYQNVKLKVLHRFLCFGLQVVAVEQVFDKADEVTDKEYQKLEEKLKAKNDGKEI